MSNETENNGDFSIPAEVNFTPMQLDAVGEIQNISMGSAATAVSNLLSAKVWITTPKVRIIQFKELSYPDLEPSIHVKIDYIKGVSGSNTMILKQSDVQLMLNQLMGLPLVVTDDFIFDEMNISAVCEVMNQMMGASATALSEFLGVSIDISTPQAIVHNEDNNATIAQIKPEEYIVAIHFNLNIDGIINSEFISIIGIDLARSLAASMLMGFGDSDEPETPPIQQPTPQISQPQPQPQPVIAQAPPEPIPQQQMQQPMYQQPPQQQYQQPMYQQPQQQYQQPMYQQPPVNVQNIQLHQFSNFDTPQQLTGDQQDNLRLLMSVPLNISVEIGTAKKKVREILEFAQGTIIELERQAGAPVDVIVNGHLIARGDVVVIDDNFAVRITDIVKSKFLDTLGNKE